MINLQILIQNHDDDKMKQLTGGERRRAGASAILHNSL